MLKLNADFKADPLVAEMRIERKKKDLELQLDELHKSHLNFAEEKEMEFSMKRKDVESGIFKPSSVSTPQHSASLRPKTTGTLSSFDFEDKPKGFENIFHRHLIHQDEMIALTMKMTVSSDHHSFFEDDLQSTIGTSDESDTKNHQTSDIEKVDDIRCEKAVVSYRN